MRMNGKTTGNVLGRCIALCKRVYTSVITFLMNARYHLRKRCNAVAKGEVHPAIRAGALIAMLFVIFGSAMLYGRAGGAGGSRSGSSGGSYSSGGGSSSSGDGGLIALLIYFIMDVIPFPFNIILIVVVLVVMGGFGKKAKDDKGSAMKQFPKTPQANAKMPDKPKGYDAFIKGSPSFDKAAYIEKVRTAFTEIQHAWAAGAIGKARRYISDGVYQRFSTQIAMMKLLEQTNTIENLTVKNIWIDKVEQDGVFDIIHTGVQASIIDRFVSKKVPQLSSGGYEEFIEYWSFIRKRGKEEKDMFHSDLCPNCNAPLPEDMGEMGKCQYCGTYVNSGEFDWVLSEITQVDDYAAINRAAKKAKNLRGKIAELVQQDENFSVQLIEDKASNAYLQILTAQTMKDASRMRRFVSDDAFSALQGRIPQETLVYNRLYLNDVTLMGALREGEKNVLAIAVKSSYQRVSMMGADIRVVDPVVKSKTEILLLERDVSYSTAKGALYMHACPACGAPVGDSLTVTCNYCGSALNSTVHEWIVKALMSQQDYEAYFDAHASEYTFKVDPGLLDTMYDVKDYAFNNVMLVIALDGVFDDGERAFAEQLAKKWGFDVSTIEPMFDLAKSGRLPLRMPVEPEKRAKVLALMEKAAAADNDVSDVERTFLDQLKEGLDIE